MEVETGKIAALIDKTDQWENVDFRQYKGLSLGYNVSKVTKQSCQKSTTKQKKQKKQKNVSEAKQKTKKKNKATKQKDKSKATEQK